MSEIVNLRQARKRKTRAEKQAGAAANRATHGRSRAAKTAARHEETRAARTHDGHRLEGDQGEDQS